MFTFDTKSNKYNSYTEAWTSIQSLSQQNNVLL